MVLENWYSGRYIGVQGYIGIQSIGISGYTLDFLISIGLRLLIFKIFSRVYGLIRKPTLIDFSQIFSAEIF